MKLNSRFKAYYITAIFSMIFAVVGFSYNAWRLEISESNNNIRTASFQVLTELAELEQIIFTRHYDNDLQQGNPRIGWVKIGLIVDMSMLITENVQYSAERLKVQWRENWSKIGTDQKAVDELSIAIDQVRTEIKATLSQLR